MRDLREMNLVQLADNYYAAVFKYGDASADNFRAELRRRDEAVANLVTAARAIFASSEQGDMRGLAAAESALRSALAAFQEPANDRT